MARDQLTYLWTATGVKTLSLGMRPTRVRFTVSQRDGAADTVAHGSDGTVIDNGTATWPECESFYMDTTGGASFRFDDRIVSHYQRVGGVITEVYRINFDSWTATGMKVNVTVKSGFDYVTNVEFET